jgi:predicted DNA-binding transcriptional regulator YafY
MRHGRAAKPGEPDLVANLLRVIAELLRGTRHSRQTIASVTQRSLPTADRWIAQIEAQLAPHVRKVREGNTTWLVYQGGAERPSIKAVVGACLAASVASVFEGSAQERNLKDARDHLLRLRGETFRDLDRKFFFVTKGGEYALPEKREELDEIIQALLDDRMLRFDYCRNSGEEEHLTIAPLSLVIFDHQFYVLARTDGAGMRAFRFARMAQVDVLTSTFDYPSKAEFDPKTFFDSLFGIHVSNEQPVEEIEILLGEPWASFAINHRWHRSQRVLRLADGRVQVKLHVRLCPEVVTWALGFGENAFVVGPPELRDTVALRLREAAGQYVKRAPGLAKRRPIRGAPPAAKAKSGRKRRAKTA